METKKLREFMIEDPFNALAIRSHLEVRNLVKKIESYKRPDGTKVETYMLKDDNGEVSVSHNKYFDLTQVIVSSEVPLTITKNLQEKGRC